MKKKVKTLLFLLTDWLKTGSNCIWGWCPGCRWRLACTRMERSSTSVSVAATRPGGSARPTSPSSPPTSSSYRHWDLGDTAPGQWSYCSRSVVIMQSYRHWSSASATPTSSGSSGSRARRSRWRKASNWERPSGTSVSSSEPRSSPSRFVVTVSRTINQSINHNLFSEQ